MLLPKLLRRIAAFAVGVPAVVAAVGFLAPMVIPECKPQMYGVGECMVASINLAPALLIAAFMGVYATVVLTAVVAGPLLLLAWWLDFRKHGDAA